MSDCFDMRVMAFEDDGCRLGVMPFGLSAFIPPDDPDWLAT
jgi:hypothetical protein